MMTTALGRKIVLMRKWEVEEGESFSDPVRFVPYFFKAARRASSGYHVNGNTDPNQAHSPRKHRRRRRVSNLCRI